MKIELNYWNLFILISIIVFTFLFIFLIIIINTKIELLETNPCQLCKDMGYYCYKFELDRRLR